MSLLTKCSTAVIAAFGAAVAVSPAVGQANPAHAHIGHVADGWRDTPDGVGLLAAARSEAEIAAQHAGLAASAGDLARVKAHIAHVMHAMDPESTDGGPGRGYGMVKAAQGAVTHMQLAAQTDGASDNVKRHAAHVIASASNVAEWGLVVLERARAVQETDDAARAAELAREIEAMTSKILAGHDENGDGRIGWGPSEGGLDQAATHLGLLKRGEGMGGAR